MAVSKLERLLNLTAALLHASTPLTVEQIREIEGYGGTSDATFRRAFERDKAELREMGIPLKVERMTHLDPPADCYRIDRTEYSGAALPFTPDELAALHIASNLVRLQGVEADNAFFKFGGLPADSAAVTEHLIEVPTEDNLGPLFKAAAERRVVRFRYNDADREVEPIRLSFNRGHWYLSGWDRGRDAERLFRVDRVDGAVAVGERTAEKRRGTASPLLEPWELGEGDPTPALVLIDADQAGWAERHLGDPAVAERRSDGSIVFRFAVRNPEAFRSYVLSFLEHAEVLEPREYRDDIVGWLRAQIEAGT